MIFIMMIYFINEIIVIITAALFSPNKSDLKYIYLAPIMILDLQTPLFMCEVLCIFYVNVQKGNQMVNVIDVWLCYPFWMPPSKNYF